MSNNEKDPLLDELEERIAEGPVMFTPDEEFLKRVAERRKEINEKGEDIHDQQLDTGKLIPILTAALQEAISRIEALEGK